MCSRKSILNDTRKIPSHLRWSFSCSWLNKFLLSRWDGTARAIAMRSWGFKFKCVLSAFHSIYYIGQRDVWMPHHIWDWMESQNYQDNLWSSAWPKQIVPCLKLEIHASSCFLFVQNMKMRNTRQGEEEWDNLIPEMRGKIREQWPKSLGGVGLSVYPPEMGVCFSIM